MYRFGSRLFLYNAVDVYNRRYPNSIQINATKLREIKPKMGWLSETSYFRSFFFELGIPAANSEYLGEKIII